MYLFTRDNFCGSCAYWTKKLKFLILKVVFLFYLNKYSELLDLKYLMVLTAEHYILLYLVLLSM